MQKGWAHSSEEPTSVLKVKVGWERGFKLNESPLMILGQELGGDWPKDGEGSLDREGSFLPVSLAKGTLGSEASSS